MTDTPSVLIVEDEEKLAEVYEQWLDPRTEIATAHTGEQALELVDESTDVVLLDRRLPDLSGDQVLEAIRARGLDCQVVIVSAIEPNIDILELGFDDYLTKPTNKFELNRVVKRGLTRRTFGRKQQEFIALATKLATIEAALDVEDLQGNPQYDELQTRFSEMIDDLQTLTADDDEYSELYQTKLQVLLEKSLSGGIEQVSST